jgi:predicted 3-demethylubiquinone-9 3-methyltransferase (glyoxalase superfamily)
VKGETVMQTRIQRITPFLWFDDQAEEAARFYTSIFPDSGIVNLTRYSREAAQAAERPEGSAMTVVFRLDGQEFIALNGGPVFRFSEAISFVVNCASQEEVDHYWERLSAGGDEEAQQCGWLKDRYGVSWQVVPTVLGELLSGPDPEKAARVMKALLQMKKIVVADLVRAARGEGTS